MFVTILKYPRDEWALVILQVDATSQAEAVVKSRNYAVDQGWSVPSAIEVYSIPDTRGANHIVTLHNFSEERR